MIRNKYLILLLLLPLFIGFNNCKPDTEDSDRSSISRDANGGGFPGKGEFEFFEPTPICSDEVGVPVRTILMDGAAETASIIVNDCVEQRNEPIIYEDVKFKPYNPYLIYYDQKIYAAPLLHQDLLKNFYYREFCFNADFQLDFTIQYLYQGNDPATDPNPEWIGVAMHRLGTGNSDIQSEPGTLLENPDGTKVFSAANGFYVVEFTGPIEDAKYATYKTRDGFEMELKCWFHRD